MSLDAHELAARRTARLAAVQALYQMEMTGASPGSAYQDLLAGRLPQDESGPVDLDADRALFQVIVDRAVDQQSAVDTLIARHLGAGWRLERIDSVARAILRAGVTEIWTRPDIPAAVSISEYVEIAKSYFDGPEPGFVNAALDACAKTVRDGDRA